MDNIFTEIEDNVAFDDQIAFNEEKIKEYIFSFINKKISLIPEKERHFFFEEMIYSFFEYINVEIIKTKKTRDFGIDGIINLNMQLLGNIKLGLQIKNTTIDSNDIDLFLSALKNSELQIGLIVCKDSRKLQKYELNNKIKAILISRGIKIKERLIKEEIDINPVFVLKFEEIIEIISSKIRSLTKMIYKK